MSKDFLIVIGAFIVMFGIIFGLQAIARMIRHKHVDYKNAKIKAAGGNKRRLAERYGDNDGR
jgi:hypothetical protein